ncbi:DUF588 domain-containing protein [Cephalotus follicularis]|uniref:CASP-like protein n=1 Tax=Cephalotus follicularis TaxID=3775 RepID=A0A1Q3C389_CEPFO|nr:DUF588 domain-containing protein [Cephalotus follicularis]
MEVKEEEKETQKAAYPSQNPPQPSSPDSSLSSPHSSHNHDFSPPQETNTKTPPNLPYPPPSPPVVVAKAGPTLQDGFVAGVGGQVEDGGVGATSRRLRPDLSILKRVRRDYMVKRFLLGFRICGFVSCLVSFSVMAADRSQGWALDSYYRYMEFRYCMAVNVIGFAYSGLHACDVAYQLITGNLKRQSQVRCYLDFSMDQVLTYLLLSASSSAAVRVDDWQSNWGKDKFTEMARASVGVSFLAFVALALSSLISGYTLCTLKSM